MKPTKSEIKLAHQYKNAKVRTPETKEASAKYKAWQKEQNPRYKWSQQGNSSFHMAKNMAKKYGCEIATDKDEIKAMKELYSRVAELNSKEGSRKWSVDHICELALGGPHVLANLHIVTFSENVKKSHRLNPRTGKRKTKATTTKTTPELWELHKTALETRGYA